MGISLSFSSGFHPQTNGQTERVNQSLEQFLRCYISETQERWVQFLPYAEFAHNNLQNASSGYSPFQVVNGRSPKFSALQVVNTSFPALDEWQKMLKSIWISVNKNLKKAFCAHKTQADRKRSVEWVFSPGDLVWVSTRHIALRQPSAKLGPKFIGPYPIKERINDVSYRVELPASMKGVKSFHVSLLKPAVHVNGPPPPPPPPVIVDGEPEYEIERILDSRKVRNSLQYLVHWKGYGPEERSWVPAHRLHAEDLTQEFHARNPGRPSLACSESPPQGGGNVTFMDSRITSKHSTGSARGGSVVNLTSCDAPATVRASTSSARDAESAALLDQPPQPCGSRAADRRRIAVSLSERSARAHTARQTLYSLRRRVS